MSHEKRIVSSLRAARAALGWSQPVFAKQAGVSLVALARMEAGMASPRLSTVAKLKTAIENAGIRIADDYPPGGYSMTVTEVAIAESIRRPAVGEGGPASEDKVV